MSAVPNTVLIVSEEIRQVPNAEITRLSICPAALAKLEAEIRCTGVG